MSAPAGALNLRTADVAQLAQRLAALSAFRRRRLMQLTSTTVLGMPRGVINKSRAENLRVALAKTTVALLPDSLDLMRQILANNRTGEFAELQFSLFVFLGDVNGLPGVGSVTETLLALVGGYLRTVKTAAAQAPWMAGDLLGDHWPLEESLPVLADAARFARYVPGRAGALHGLSHALARSDKRAQWRIVEVLQNVARSDRSQHVRASALHVLGPLRGL